MKTGISERDKKLLVGLVLFLIIVCIGYWGVFPQIIAIGDINNQITEEEIIRAENDAKINSLIFIETENDELKKDIEELRKTFFPMMTSDQLDRMFTGLALDYELNSYDMIIYVDDETATLKPYIYAEVEKDSTDSFGEGSLDSEFEDDYEDLSGVHRADITMRVGGEEENLYKFIDYLSDTEDKIRLTNYYFTNINEAKYKEDGTYEIKESVMLNIKIEIYMCEEKSYGN